jgi:AraC-like DNA-binding protein/quercetin dioxygenase-like cupin family protein
MHTLRASDWFGPDGPDGFPLSIVRKEPQDRFVMHAHEFSEIVMVFGGRALHVIGNESWPVAAGDVFVVGSSEAHVFREIKDLRLINVLFIPENVRLEPTELAGFSGYQELFSFQSKINRRTPKRRLSLKPKELSIALNFVDSLEHEIKMREPGYSFMGLSYFMQIVCYLSRAYGRSEQARAGQPPAAVPPGIRRAVQWLEENFATKVSIETLAVQAGLSPRHFARSFLQATGYTPYAYLLWVRLDRARELLKQPGRAESLKEIAGLCGFFDQTHFGRHFRRMFGTTPAAFAQVQQRLSASRGYSGS